MDNFRTNIISTARSWIGTKFHHQGRIKKSPSHSGGCDCIGLIIGVLEECGVNLEKTNINNNYPRIPQTNLLEEQLSKYFLKRNNIDDGLDGDIILMKFDKYPQHLGFLSLYDNDYMEYSIIHSYIKSGAVVEHRLDEYWSRKIVAIYDIGTAQI